MLRDMVSKLRQRLRTMAGGHEADSLAAANGPEAAWALRVPGLSTDIVNAVKGAAQAAIADFPPHRVAPKASETMGANASSA